MKSSNEWSSYTVSEKNANLKKVEKFMEEFGYSAQKACTKVGFSQFLFLKTNAYCYTDHLYEQKTNHSGSSSILKANQDDLLKLVAKMRDTGMPINTKMVQFEAARINHSYCNKCNHAKKSIVESFLRSNAIIYSKGTHESQKVTKQQSINFIDVFHPIVYQTYWLPRFIYNCDQSGFLEAMSQDCLYLCKQCMYKTGYFGSDNL